MSVYVADRGAVHMECDMAYTKYRGEGGYYVPCEIEGPVSLECLADGLGASRGICVETELVKICGKEGGGLEAIIDVARCISRGVTPGELVKQMLIIAELCARRATTS
ncbi:MAG: hypothetical protein AT711_00515 [Thermoproteus sp. CIS_19]|nr:MAG: hypothetical protein AT711_00515 [Thermoproteus sp. CIS_19]